MNTIMEEKIKQAFQEWKEQPKEIIMTKQTKNKTLSNMLLNMVLKNPGITGKDLRAYVSREMPTVPVSYVPAILKGFYDNNIVNRVEIENADGINGRNTYAYTIIPESERESMPKREKVKAYTKKKVKPNKGISALVPTGRVATRPLGVGPTTLSITISTGDAAYTLRLEEAKFIYQQLHQIFGGAR